MDWAIIGFGDVGAALARTRLRLVTQVIRGCENAEASTKHVRNHHAALTPHTLYKLALLGGHGGGERL